MVDFIDKKVSRERYILKQCENRNVLNVGCLAADKKSALHSKIEAVAKSVWGLDIFDSKMENYIKGDAQNFSTNEKFDVIIVGEVIEHLWNVEGLLKSAHNSLTDGGALIITTPNAYSPVQMKNAIFGQVVPNDPYHVLLFDVTTLKNLLNNFSSKLFDGNIFYYEEEGSTSVIYRMQRFFENWKNGYCRGIIAELVKLDSSTSGSQ